MRISIHGAASAPTVPSGIQIDRKRLQRLREKIAMGHKPGDHEEQRGWTMTMEM